MRTRLIESLLVGVALVSALHISLAAAQQTTVNLRGSAQVPVFEPVIKAFIALNPSIVVKYQQVPLEDLNAAVESRIDQDDSNIDVF